MAFRWRRKTEERAAAVPMAAPLAIAALELEFMEWPLFVRERMQEEVLATSERLANPPIVSRRGYRVVPEAYLGLYRPGIIDRDAEAIIRARELLNRLLTPAQRREWNAHGSFIETGGDGRAYCLLPHGVYRIDPETGQRLEWWCVQPADRDMPPEDAVIARLLHLRADPEPLRQIANIVRMAV